MPPWATTLTTPTTLQPRAADDGSGLPAKTIVAIVCGALGGLLILLFVARALVRFRLFRPAPAPLPPVQELAHHRAAERAASARARDAQSGWLEPASLPRQHGRGKGEGGYPIAPGSDGSVVSLVREEAATPTSQSGWEQGSMLSKEPSQTDSMQLPPLQAPQRPFLEYRVSVSGSSESSGHTSPGLSSGFSRQSSVPGSISVSPTHPMSSVASSTTSLAPRPRPRSRPRQQAGSSRAHSTNSSVSRGTARSRGAPHSRRSTMHIVLPAPLAPQISTWSRAGSVASGSSSPERAARRFSSMSDAYGGPAAVDSWVHVSGRSVSRERVDSNASKRRSASRPPARKAKPEVASAPVHSRAASSPPESTPSMPAPEPEPEPMPSLPIDHIPSIALSFIPSSSSHPEESVGDFDQLAGDPAEAARQRPLSTVPTVVVAAAS